MSAVLAVGSLFSFCGLLLGLDWLSRHVPAIDRLMTAYLERQES